MLAGRSRQNRSRLSSARAKTARRLGRTLPQAEPQPTFIGGNGSIISNRSKGDISTLR